MCVYELVYIHVWFMLTLLRPLPQTHTHLVDAAEGHAVDLERASHKEKAGRQLLQAHNALTCIHAHVHGGALALLIERLLTPRYVCIMFALLSS